MADITVDNMQDALEKLMEQYRLILSPEVTKALVKQTNKTAKGEAEAISHDAPRRRSSGGKHYAEGFTVRRANGTGGYGEIEVLIYNKTKPTLTHLLEYGHDIVDRNKRHHGSVRAIPHIKPNDEKYREIYVDSIESLLKSYMGG